MTKGNPNDATRKLNFVAKVYDPDAGEFKPIYIAPEATSNVLGDVYLSDATNGTQTAATGVTAATPAAVKAVQDNANNKLDTKTLSAQTVAGPVTFNSSVTAIDENNGFHGNLTGNVKGNADTASQLKTPRAIAVKSGNQPAGSATFNGAGNVTITIPKIDGTTIEGIIPLASIPQGALEKLIKVRNEEARFQLTTNEVQLGDSVLQIDTGVMYIVVDESNLSNSNGYQEYKAATALKAEEANRLGSDTIGSSSLPIYLNGGTPVAIEKLAIENGGTASNSISSAANSLKYSSMGERINILESENLNNYKETGSFFCPNSVISTVLNKPEKAKKLKSFTLDVVENVSGNNNYIRQILRPSNNFYTWERLYLNPEETDDTYPKVSADGWTDWNLAGGGNSANSGTIIDSDSLNPIEPTIPAEDSQSENIISVTTSEGEKEPIFTVSVEDLQLGAYSVIIRNKVSSNASTNKIFKIEIFSEAPDDTSSTALLKTVYIAPNFFYGENIWECLSFGINFTGKRNSKIKIVGTPVSNNESIVYSIDYIKILPAGTALGSIG